jgi:eukaryotic-like serine/threonine-protein kinase
MSPERWQKIEAAFQDAMDLDASEREAFLAAHFPDDDALRNEVRKLILSSDSASDFIESPVWTDSAFLDTSVKKEISNSLDNGSSTAGTDSMLGRRVGVYRLTKEIGRGGMGAVYKAERDDGEFQQTVAIKLIKRGMDSDFIVRRFRHERQILASFEHAFIASLLDGGTTEEGVPYFVMEYIEGETLYNYCDKRRLDLRDRLKIFQKVCSAIDYAHSRQIIHRDIKPSNILIRNGSPKLLDFGIAKILDPNLIHESLNPTASMLRMMTPDYASPEQVQGADVKPSSDIYSLGVLLYELLTGHRPYSFAGRALHEVTQVICEVMPELPSRVVTSDSGLLPQYGSDPGAVLAVRQTDVGSLSTQLSAGLDNIIMRAVNKQPQDRYGSAAELSRDISRYLRGEKVLAPRYERANRIAADPMLQAPETAARSRCCRSSS